MSNSPSTLRDNGGRRSGLDLRQFSYTGHIPERRSGNDRRSESDRRNDRERRTCEDRRNSLPPGKKSEHETKIIDLRTNNDRRSGKDRRVAFG